ncbi:hypothetical protein O181_005337 [Austropuccinia psidii MF-1]|uniref:Uncharacterized protein n=1 Tax=Austropuccinia psidii MF-1 TaxID=1389203 RepID=A0A9Q3BHX0_9BASI|nr:hypothetical protein [Austropuccinia psidii MF-1]
MLKSTQRFITFGMELSHRVCDSIDDEVLIPTRAVLTVAKRVKLHKDGNIHKNADGLGRWLLPNDVDNPAYVPEEASPPIPIEGTSVTDLNTTFFQEVRTAIPNIRIVAFHPNYLLNTVKTTL